MGSGNFYLVEGNATDLIFDDASFDGYWSVQTLQHIPDFMNAVNESFRVLKEARFFVNYSLNKQVLVKWIYSFFGKTYHDEDGYVGRFFLAKASDEQFFYIDELYKGGSYRRFSEIIFEQGLRIMYPGIEGSVFGALDRKLSGSHRLFSGLARQQSSHAFKNA